MGTIDSFCHAFWDSLLRHSIPIQALHSLDIIPFHFHCTAHFYFSSEVRIVWKAGLVFDSIDSAIFQHIFFCMSDAT